VISVRAKPGRQLGPRFERRLHVEPRRAALCRIAGLLVGLAVAGLALQLTGRDTIQLAIEVARATFGSRFGLEETAIIATPILLDAIAVSLALRMRLWNIGVEGQFLIGAWAATGIGIHLQIADPLLLFLMALAGMAAGAAWILIPAIARAYWKVNEIITTLLLNFVALSWVEWFSIQIWRDKAAAVVQATPPVNARLPLLPGANILHVGFLIPLILAPILWWVFRSSRWGYEVDMIGGNPRAAAFAGIDVKRRILAVMLLSGAIGGLSGMIHLTGAAGRLQGGISNAYGLSGFIVAALAGASFIGLVAGGLFIALLLHSGIVLQGFGLSIYIVLAIYGTVLVGIAVGEMAARYRFHLTRGRSVAAHHGGARASP
jgi:general nucleoside transport system permease protein